MREEDIRSRTKVILDAYAEVSGMDAVLDISDFLKVRMEAISELGGQIAGAKVKTTARLETSPQVEQRSPVQIPKTSSKPPENASYKESVQPASMQSVPVQTAVPQNSEPSALESSGFEPLDMGVEEMNSPEEHPKSVFDILRGIKDPWN